MDSDIQNSVRNDFSGKTYLKLADTFFNITVNEHLKEILNYISENSYKALSLLSNTNQYKKLIKKI